MKKIALISFFLFFALLTTSCSASEPDHKDSILGDQAHQSETSDETASSLQPQQTTSTDNGSSSTETVKPWNEDRDYSHGFNVISDLPTEYNGEELTITLEIANNGQSYEQAFLLYVNGKRNDYSTDKNSEKKPYHLNYAPQDETVQITIYFTPNNCSKGETAVIGLESMLTPEYTLPDTSYVNFWPHHTTIGILPFTVAINEDTPADEYNTVFYGAERTETTEEFEREHIFDPGDGGEPQNSLDQSTVFDLYKTDRWEDYITADDELTLNISVFGQNIEKQGKSDKYLLSIYINHEIQPAFDGNYYAYCEADRQHITALTAVIDTSQLSGINHIYMMAVPCEPDAIEQVLTPYKSSSKILSIEEN